MRDSQAILWRTSSKSQEFLHIFGRRIVTLTESGLNNSKIRDTILRDENVCVSQPGTIQDQNPKNYRVVTFQFEVTSIKTEIIG